MIQQGHLDLELMMKGARQASREHRRSKRLIFLQASIYKYIYTSMSD